MFSQTLLSRLPKPLSCRILAPLLTKSVEAGSTLTSRERSVIDAHLAVCPVCFEEMEGIRALGMLLRTRGADALPAHVPASNLWDRIEEGILAEERVVHRAPSLRPVLIFAPAFAAVVVAAIVLPKLGHSPSVPEADHAPAAASRVAPSSAPAPKAFLAEAKTNTSIPAAISKPTPSATFSRHRSSSQNRLVAMVTQQAQKRNMAAAHRSQEVNRFSGIIEVIPVPRGGARAVSVVSTLPKSMPPLRAAGLPRMMTKSAPVLVATAKINSFEPRPVTPSESYATQSDATSDSESITVVNSYPGNGVSSAAYAPPPVTDTLMRQRQKRGLFGGYGTGSAMAILPSGGGTGTGSETASPW